MGRRAQQFFDEYGIETIVGISGSVEEAIEKIVKGMLQSEESLCSPGAGKGYGVEKNVCDHPNGEHEHDDDTN